MNDRGDELVRQAAELKAESRHLVAVSEGLAGRLAKMRKAWARAMGQRGGKQPPGVPGGDRTGDVSVPPPGPWPGTGVLDEDEAVTLAVLLEDLAARHGPDPLSGPAVQAAAMLRERVAAGHRRDIRLRSGGPAVRRETGDTRDGAADHRDTQAAQRDHHAGERDARARERDRQADAGDETARAGEQRIRDRLRTAGLRDQAAAAQPPASSGAGRRQWQPGRESAGADQARDRHDRQAIGEMLTEAQTARQAALQDRYAAGQDRVAARRDRDAAEADRQAAARDRQAARADRDQAVIESEEQAPHGD